MSCWTEATGRALASPNEDDLSLDAQLHAQFATTAEGQRYVALYLSAFTGKTVTESAGQIGVDPQALARILLYLPLTQRE
ncbi:MAG: hypothetical protein KJZ86_22235 [Caldilineaceae bacterium]|nr:hypothetical protein [Caldilineaceae bacterium]HRJ42445.1 hypothetical protein [Caldilineaceae bacterium]